MSNGNAQKLTLRALMGTNLREVYFADDKYGHERPTITSLNADTLTTEGTEEWSDVLDATVDEIKDGVQCIVCRLSNCDAHRVTAFAEMLNGQCNAEDYERWVKKTGVNYASSDQLASQSIDARYDAHLVAIYEELTSVPSNKRITYYFGDYGLDCFNYGVTEDQVRSIYDKALEAMGMTENEYQEHRRDYNLRADMITRMRDGLLASELKTGEEVLFVATEPYGGSDDFQLRGGVILAIDPEQRTCQVRGDFFTMNDVPLHYVLGRHDLEVKGKHYGWSEVSPLFGEHPELAHKYLQEVEAAYHERWNSLQTQESPFTQSM